MMLQKQKEDPSQGPFSEIILVDVKMRGNQFLAKASLYRRFDGGVYNMEFVNVGLQCEAVVLKHAVTAAVASVSRNRRERIFIDAGDCQNWSL